MAGVIKVTIVDSPEKMRPQSSGYSIIIPQVRDKPETQKQQESQNKTSKKQIRHSLRDRLRAVECPSDIVDAIGGWKTSGVVQGNGNGYPLEVLERWMMKI